MIVGRYPLHVLALCVRGCVAFWRALSLPAELSPCITSAGCWPPCSSFARAFTISGRLHVARSFLYPPSGCCSEIMYLVQVRPAFCEYI